MCLFAQHQNVGLNLKGKYIPIWFHLIISYSDLVHDFKLVCLLYYSSYSWKVLRVQKCRNIEKTAGGNDELGQATGPSSTSVPEEQIDKNKSPDINDDDFDLDALAEALEQAATLASNSKKKNKSKRANAPIKRPVLKKTDDLSIPGEENFLRICYHVYEVWIFWSDGILLQFFLVFTYIMIRNNTGENVLWVQVAMSWFWTKK